MNKAEDEFNTQMSKVLAFESSLQAKVNAMPSGTLEQRIAKSAEWIKGMALYKK